MSKRMLIDATHVEETRVAVVNENRLEEFDYESEVRKQLKGNVFLAKVTRVEPSLQAAFVNFGGNRHGFLPFSEVHPDYFRIPIADREAILAEQEEEMEARRKQEEAEDEAADEEDEDNGDGDGNGDDEEDNNNKKNSRNNKRGGRNRKGRSKSARNRDVEHVGGDQADSEPVSRRPSLRRNYKIQEVVKRGQIMLIQVNKEERGNKGAAVSTYLSLPGRYCVLMPNSPRAGGVSRKIANSKERKRMREILRELQVPDGMSVIMRTAGVERNKTEIKRDLDYLIRLWNNIREKTLESTAPALIHEEGKLLNRAIRDIYTRDIEEVLVAGDEGYKQTKEFMKMMIPSHARRVKQYKDDKFPLFQRYQAENQIMEIGEPVVTLKSGGYLVINPTEALVAVDVNSGRATKERHIEETALKTNLESAEEVARQLRLRDLGGLVVIDFIDMEDRRNNRKVEQKLKQALSSDRARIQVGSISSLGLLELSRQRLNPSLTEAQFAKCDHCDGVGYVRSVDSAAINALRALEEEGVRDRAKRIVIHMPNDMALYMLNYKRDMLATIEERYGFRVMMQIDEAYAPSGFQIEPVKDPEDEDNPFREEIIAAKKDREDSSSADQQDKKSGDDQKSRKDDDDDEDGGKSKRGSRRRGRRGGKRRSSGKKPSENESSGSQSGDKTDDKKDEDSGTEDSKAPKEDKATEEDKTSGKKTPSGKSSAGSKKSAKKDNSKEAEKAETKDDNQSRSKDETGAKDQPDDSEKKSGKQAEDGAKSNPSNDDTPAEKDYEVVNQEPEKKKKGWWSRIKESS